MDVRSLLFFPFFPHTQSENSSFFIFFSLPHIDERDRRVCFGAEKQIYRMCIMTNNTPSVLHIKQNTTVGATKAIRSFAPGPTRRSSHAASYIWFAWQLRMI